eukprot:scaffold90225_cov21-Tisochrysis_lutea.AAC.1
MVEAAVSIGGRDARPGITAYRFANRIPLLFEVCCLCEALRFCTAVIDVWPGIAACPWNACTTAFDLAWASLPATQAQPSLWSSGASLPAAFKHISHLLDLGLCASGGSDVITKTANKRINWGSYKINSSSDK